MTKRMIIYGVAAMFSAGLVAGTIAALLHLPPAGGILLGFILGGCATFWAIGRAEKHDWPAA